MELVRTVTARAVREVLRKLKFGKVKAVEKKPPVYMGEW